MKQIIATILLFHFLTVSFGQSQTPDIKSMVDSLQYLKVDTLDCNASLYWRIVAQGGKAIPFLIDKLDDTTLTKISNNCKAIKLNVGEVAYFALQQIAFFPAFVITHIQFDFSDNKGCWSFFDYFFNNANKRHYQDLVRKWYDDNKEKFKARKISKKRMTECQKIYHIDKYLMWTE